MQKSFIILAVFIFSAGLLHAQAQVSTMASPTVNGQLKTFVMRHNNPICPVTGINVSGDHPKYPMVYVEGNIEHHFYVANRMAAKQFQKNPQQYMAKLKQIETGQ